MISLVVTIELEEEKKGKSSGEYIGTGRASEGERQDKLTFNGHEFLLNPGGQFSSMVP